MNESIRKFFKIAGLVLAGLLVGAQFVGPKPTNPQSDPSKWIYAQARVPEEVAVVLNRSCLDCHSNKTRWPWYSRVAPVSWFVVDHVNHGRRHMNFNEWGARQEDWGDDFNMPALVEAMCKQVSDGAMPLPSYTWMHRDAKLSPAEVKTLCAWTVAERERLARSNATP